MTAFLNHTAIELGERNLERVRAWGRLHPWGTQMECARDLELSLMAVNRHVKKIREEWRSAVDA